MEKTRKSKRKQSSGEYLTIESKSENHQACDRKAESCDMSVEGGMVKKTDIRGRLYVKTKKIAHTTMSFIKVERLGFSIN